MKDKFLLFLIASLYCFGLFLAGWLNIVNVVFVAIILVAYYTSNWARHFLITILFLLIQSVVFDLMRHVPFSWLAPVQVGAPYYIEKFLFGIQWHGSLLTPNEFLSLFSHPVFDLMSGCLYNFQNYFLFSIIFVLRKVRDKETAFRFCFAVFLISMLTYTTWFFLPVAPPWYINQYGFQVPHHSVVGNAAGLVRFDKLLHISFSQSTYALNPFVFGAFPSMHAGYAALIFLFLSSGLKKWTLAGMIYFVCMGFCAVYTGHHYFLDVIAGSLYALLGWVLTEKVFHKKANTLYAKLCDTSIITL